MNSRIIKGSDSPDDSRRDDRQKIVKREIQEANAEAGRILRDAEERAERLLEEARREAEKLRQEAVVSGEKEGLFRLHDILVEFEQTRDRRLESFEPELLQLAVSIAHKIVGRELELRDDCILNIVQEAIASAPRDQRLTLRLHPSQIEQVRSELEELSDHSAKIELRPSEKLGPGDCIVETELGSIDARLDVQLESIQKALLRRSGEKGTG